MTINWIKKLILRYKQHRFEKKYAGKCFDIMNVPVINSGSNDEIEIYWDPLSSIFLWDNKEAAIDYCRAANGHLKEEGIKNRLILQKVSTGYRTCQYRQNRRIYENKNNTK